MDVLMLPKEDEAMPMEVMDVSNEDEEERRRKRQKKKKTNRPPLCTFVNYLGPPVAKPTPSPTATAPATVSEPTSRAEDDLEEDKPMEEEDTGMADHPEDQDGYPTDDRDDDGILLMKGVMVTTEPIETSPLSNDRDVIDDVVPTVPTIPSTTKFLLTTTTGGGGDDNDSVETVNTSNKSVDVYLRPDSSFDNTPAVERWMKPPPSAPIAKDMLEKLDGLYVTSRSESDEEEEEPPRPLPEIVVKTRRHRLPSLHSQWRTKHSKRYCLG